MKKLFLKSLALVVLLVCSMQSHAVTAHFNLLGTFWSTADWGATSTQYPMSTPLNNNIWNEYYRVLKLTSGDYYFALNNGTDRYAPETDQTVMALNVGGAFGTYTANNAWKVTIPEDGYYRVIVDESAGLNGEWYPAVRVETNALKIQQGWAGWADADMTRDGDVYTATFTNMTPGDKEFVIRGNGNVLYYYNTTGVTTSNSEIALSQTSNEYPNFKFNLAEGGDVTITLTYNPSNPMEVEVNVAAVVEPFDPNAPVDWSTIGYMATAALPAWDNKFKVQPVPNLNIVNIQQPGFVTKPGLYLEAAPALGAITAVEGAEGYKIQGGGVVLYCDEFVDRYNTITLTCALGSITFQVYYAEGKIYSEYCEELVSSHRTETHEPCEVYLTWETLDNGNVVITASTAEGNDGESGFRGNGMNDANGFKLNGSVDDFNTYFTRVKGPNTGDYFYTYTLELKDVENRPAAESVISYSGQIELRSSAHTNDWSLYSFDHYTYGTKCKVTADSEAPIDLNAEVVLTSATSVKLSLTATDAISSKIYYTITDNNSNVYNVLGQSGANTEYVVKNLTPSTAYTFSVVASDAAENGNETTAIEVNATTAAPATVVTYFAKGSDTYQSVPFDCYYSITRQADETLVVTMLKTGSIVENTFTPQWNDGDYRTMTKVAENIYTYTTNQSYVEGSSFRGFCYFGGPRFDFNYTVGAESAPYTRDVTAGKYGTLCLPFTADVTGVQLYTIAGKTANDIVLEEVAGNVAEAGKAYVYYAENAGTLTATYTAVAAHGINDGLVGVLKDTQVTLNGTANTNIYFLSNNKLMHWTGNDDVTVAANKAYFDLTDVSAPSSVAARRIPFEDQVATTFDAVAADSNVVKLIENGQIIIIKNGVRYNALGQVVR